MRNLQIGTKRHSCAWFQPNFVNRDLGHANIGEMSFAAGNELHKALAFET